MGQYHVITNVSKRVGYSPRSVGGLLKLMELGHSTVALAPLFLLLEDDWAGDRIAIIGDYAEDGDLPEPARHEAGLSEKDIYSAVSFNKEMKAEGHDVAGWKPVGWLARQVLDESGIVTVKSETAHMKTMGSEEETTWTYYTADEAKVRSGTEERVMVNLDREQVLRPEEFGDDPHIGVWSVRGTFGGMITATAMLLGVSSVDGGRGGGDFRLDDEFVGSWGGERLAVVSLEKAEDYTDISSEVREVLEEGGEGVFSTRTGKVRRAPNPWSSNPWNV